MLFISNKYTTWYFSLIENRKSTIPEGYVEKHHIIPKSIGGTDDSDNLVALTAREHFLAHWLLTKMTKDNEQVKMKHALGGMTGNNHNGRTLSSYQYAICRQSFSEARKGVISPHMLRSGEDHHMFGKKRPRQSLLMSGENNPNYGKFGENHHCYGKKHKDDRTERMTKTLQSLGKLPCPNCGEMISPLNSQHKRRCINL
jgi:hypothetical protein